MIFMFITGFNSVTIQKHCDNEKRLTCSDEPKERNHLNLQMPLCFCRAIGSLFNCKTHNSYSFGSLSTLDGTLGCNRKQLSLENWRIKQLMMNMYHQHSPCKRTWGKYDESFSLPLTVKEKEIQSGATLWESWEASSQRTKCCRFYAVRLPKNILFFEKSCVTHMLIKWITVKNWVMVLKESNPNWIGAEDQCHPELIHSDDRETKVYNTFWIITHAFCSSTVPLGTWLQYMSAEILLEMW